MIHFFQGPAKLKQEKDSGKIILEGRRRVECPLRIMIIHEEYLKQNYYFLLVLEELENNSEIFMFKEVLLTTWKK